MTNYDKLTSLPKDELAWLLMNGVTGCFHGCPLCIYKDWSECKEIGEGLRLSCIEGHRQWLDREPTAEDEILYARAKHNVLVTEFNYIPQEERINHKCVYENGYVVRIEYVEPYKAESEEEE